MQFTLTINCNNAAFGEPDEDSTMLLDEVAHILRKAADTVESGLISECPLRDSNGNTVGRFELKED